MKKVILSVCAAAAVLSATMFDSVMPSRQVYAEQSSQSLRISKLSTKEQAIAKANVLKLIPARAQITKASEILTSTNAKQWVLLYAEPEVNQQGQAMLSGRITLDVSSGAVVGFMESKRAPEKELNKLDMDGSSSASNAKSGQQGNVSKQAAIEKAQVFIASLPWELDVDWMLNPNPETAYDTRFDEPSQHKIRFQSSHKGIRLEGGPQFTIYVDMGTGELSAYDVNWNAVHFVDVKNPVSIGQVQGSIIHQLKPELQYYYIDESRPVSLLYSIPSVKVKATNWDVVIEETRGTYNPGNWPAIGASKRNPSENKARVSNQFITEQMARASAEAYLKLKIPARFHLLSEESIYMTDGEEKRYRIRYITAVSGIPSFNDYVEVEIDAKSGKQVSINSALSDYNYPKQMVPVITPERAKRILLSLYDVEPQYQLEQDGQAHLYYQLVAKPETPLFYTGQAPYLDAINGVFSNFLGEKITEPLPAASPWLKDFIALPEKINYKVAVVLDGKLMKLQDEPVIRHASTLMPFRELLQGIGATFIWDGVNRKVIAKTKDTVLELTIDSDTAYINGQPYSLYVPAQLVNQRTYVPARFIANALGATVNWDPKSRLVLLQTDDQEKLLTEDELRQLRYEAEEQWEVKYWQ